MENKKVAIYPGTFDPITYGHLDIITRSARIFEKITIGIAHDTKKNSLFSLEERVALVESEIKKLQILNITVKPFRGLLVDFVKNEKARIIIRGIRALSDFEYEFQMAYMNHKLNHDVETIFMPATENSHFISSSFVKEVARLNGSLQGLVSNTVAIELKKLYGFKE